MNALKSVVRSGLLVFCFAGFLPRTAWSAPETSAAMPSSARVTCSTETKKAAVVLAAAGGVSAEVPITVTPQQFKSGKLRGCAALTRKSKAKVAPLAAGALKGAASGVTVHVALPADENGMAYELTFDWIAVRRADGTWAAGPVVSGGGLENEVENVVLSAGEGEATVKRTSSGEGDSTTETLRFTKTKDGWRRSK